MHRSVYGGIHTVNYVRCRCGSDNKKTLTAQFSVLNVRFNRPSAVGAGRRNLRVYLNNSSPALKSQLPPVQIKPRSTMTLEQLAINLCHDHNVTIDTVRSPSRQRSLTRVRLLIVQQAIDKRIATAREVATFLNRDPSSISELLARYHR